MSPREVSFDLERFGWADVGRLEVIGRWSGLRGRVGRPVLTVAGRRLPALPGAQLQDEHWRAVFAWDGDPADVKGAELEVGRSLVVDLPPPRRLRRRPAAPAPDESELAELRVRNARLEAELAALRAGGEQESAGDPEELGAARAELESLRDRAAEIDTLRAELAAARADATALRARAQDDSELAGLRIAHGSLRAAHEQLEDELEALRGVREERDDLAGELEQLRSETDDSERAKADVGEMLRELQARASEADAARRQLMDEVQAARAENAELRTALDEARADAERRLDTERATTTEVHSRLATAREEAQKTMAAEAQETERLRVELDTTRADAERLLAAERAEVARLREELATRADDTAGDEAGESSRRMLERVARDLDRERATTRHLRRELDSLRSESAEHRRAVSSATANGTATMDDPPVRAVRTPAGTQRRVEAARAASARRVPRVPPSAASLWAVRIGAALLVAVLGIALVLALSALT